MQCQEIRELLSPYCDNMLDEAQRTQVDQHLQGCEQCRQELEELRFVIELMQGSTEVLAPEDFSRKVTERLDSLPPVKEGLLKPVGRSRVITWGRVAAVAAMLVIAAAIGLEENGGLSFDAAQKQSQADYGSDSSYNELKAKSAQPSAAGAPAVTESAHVAADGTPAVGSGSAEKRLMAGKDQAAQSNGAVPVQRKLITNGRVQLEVTDFDSAYAKIIKAVEKYQGYVENSTFSNSPKDTPLLEQNHSGRLTIRVPAGQFNALLEEVKQVGTVVFREMGSQDVSTEFYDTQARLRNWKQQETRLLEILKQAKNVDEILRVEGELQRVRQEVEVMESRIKTLGNLTEMATLELEINQVNSKKAIQIQKSRNVFPRAAEAFIGTINGLLDVLGKTVVFLGELGPVLIILAVVIGLLYIILRHRKNGKPPSGE